MHTTNFIYGYMASKIQRDAFYNNTNYLIAPVYYRKLSDSNVILD